MYTQEEISFWIRKHNRQIIAGFTKIRKQQTSKWIAYDQFTVHAEIYAKDD